MSLTDADLKRFFSALVMCNVRVPPDFVPDASSAMWRSVLDGFVSPEELRAFPASWARGPKAHIWPTPRDVISGVRALQGGHRSPEEAWEKAIAYYQWCDRNPHKERPQMVKSKAESDRILWAMKAAGGWIEYRQAENENVHFFRRRFVDAYMTWMDRENHKVEQSRYSELVERLSGKMSLDFAEQHKLEDKGGA